MLSRKEFIYLVALILGFLIRLTLKEKKESNWLDEVQKRQQNRFEYLNKNIIRDEPEYPSRSGKWTASGWVFDNETQSWKAPDYQTQTPEIQQQPNSKQQEKSFQSMTGKWTTSGWVFDSKTQTWQAPDYLAEESRIKWRWDEEKQIWIDAGKEERMARYREYHKDRPPTFEEWKAMKEQQQKNEQHPGE